VSGQLDGIRILDLTRLLPGPFATMILGDLGADVIRVESPDGGDLMRVAPPYVNGRSAPFTMVNRNKRSVAINLKDPRGRDIFLRLARTAEAVVEGFRPGVADRLGVGYEAVRKVRADIVYCSISGYGQTGPYRDRAGHDINYISLAGVLDLLTEPETRPRTPGILLGDLSGSLYAVIGILAGLLGRQQTGQGTYIDVSMHESLLALNTFMAARHLIAGVPPKHGMRAMAESEGSYQVYECKDGGYVALGALEEKFWANFCKAIERPDLLDRQRDPSAAGELERLFKERDRDKWVSLSAEHDFCCEPVLSLGEALHHPHVLARGMIVEGGDPSGGHVRYLASPIIAGGGRGEVRRPAPHVGEHTEEILLDAGVSREQIERLLADGILARTERLQRDTTS
jgi:alpha-methylacyl-CoA racemase